MDQDRYANESLTSASEGEEQNGPFTNGSASNENGSAFRKSHGMMYGEEETEETGVISAPLNPKLICRMYENQYPEINDLVMVSVKRIAEMGAYVSLLEYSGIEGMVLLSELSRRRMRSVHRLIRVGRLEVVVVLRVDKEKGYIDLSKRRVSPEEVEQFEERYSKSKTVHSILRHVAEVHDMELEALYKMVGWPLYSRYKHAYDAFKSALTNPEEVWSGFIDPATGVSSVPDAVRKDIMQAVIRRLSPQKVKLRADIEVACFAYEGIDAVKKALAAGEAVSTSDIPIKASLVAPPLYVITTQCMERVVGLQIMNNALDAIEKTIRALDGHFVVKMKAKAVSETDEKALDALMRKSELDNTEEYSD